jgi:hypothetical protein
MAELTIQPSINDVRSNALLELLERLDSLDLVPILVYRLESAPDSALVFLAWQFDMLDPEWQLAAQVGESWDALTTIDGLTDIDTLSSVGSVAGPSDFDSLRALLKSAIPLHRIRGTPYSISTALQSLGWNQVAFQEGQESWGGTSWPVSEGWAVFRVYVQLAESQPVAPSGASRTIAAINFFKPVRAWLDSLWFIGAPITDELQPPADSLVSIFAQLDKVPSATDALNAEAWPVNDTKVISPLYDGHFYHSGITYGADEPSVADDGIVNDGEAVSDN